MRRLWLCSSFHQMMSNEYKYECVSPGVYVAVSENHGFGTDAVLLADFARPCANDTILDMGTGCGVIPLIWLKYNLYKPVHCIDIQQTAIDQVNSGIEKSGATGKIIAKCCDLRDYAKTFTPQSYNLITMNPPYKQIKSGVEPSNEHIRISKYEISCNMAEISKAAARLLKVGGRFCICNRPERLSDVIVALKENKLEPKRLRFVSDRPGKEPFLFLLESRKGARPYLKVEKELYINNENSEPTEEIKEIYGEYAEGNIE